MSPLVILYIHKCIKVSSNHLHAYNTYTAPDGKTSIPA